MQEVFEKIIANLEKEKLRCFDTENQLYTDKIGIWCFDRAKEVVTQVVAEYNNGWIPVEDRLPEVEADVLLSLRSLDIYTGFRANTEGCFYVEGEGYVEDENVLAWKPLPEPYQPKGE